MPHSLAHNGRHAHDLWQHPAGHRGHLPMEHAGLVARVQAA